MRFWDSSALLPLFVVERSSQQIRELMAIDDDVIVWTLTIVEILSATWRREPFAYDDGRRAAAAALAIAADAKWAKVADLRATIAMTNDLARRYRLRAGDTIQLAAALLASEGDPANLPFVTLDGELATAARAEGFAVLP